MRIAPILVFLIILACESREQGSVVYTLNNPDSLVYEVNSLVYSVQVHQQRIRMNEPSFIRLMIYDQDKKSLIHNSQVKLTVINKGRRKACDDLQMKEPGVFEGNIRVNFAGLSILEIEIINGDNKSSEYIEQEIMHK